MKKSFIITISFALILLFSTPIFSQDSKKATPKKPVDIDLIYNFHDLEKERLEIIAEMYSMMYEISGLFTELERAQSLEKLVEKHEDLRLKGNNPKVISKEEEKNLKRIEEMKSQIVVPELKSVGGLDIKKMNPFQSQKGSVGLLKIKYRKFLKKQIAFQQSEQK
ncbi:MAG: hypothetical protein JKY02_05020 [Flavobacteriaceae bacterium]|nr:hypothetical protein [Flavobacteriaceae bacterium]